MSIERAAELLAAITPEERAEINAASDRMNEQELRPLCKHDPADPRPNCAGCREWHHPVRGPAYQDAMRRRAGLPSVLPKRELQCPPTDGPGTRFKALADAVGYRQFKGCVCESIRIEMDRMGSEKVRANLDRYATAINANFRAQHKTAWGRLKAIARAAPRALRRGIVVNPLDPIPGLILIACRQAES